MNTTSTTSADYSAPASTLEDLALRCTAVLHQLGKVPVLLVGTRTSPPHEFSLGADELCGVLHNQKVAKFMKGVGEVRVQPDYRSQRDAI